MKTTLVFLGCCLSSSLLFAQVNIDRNSLGSGTPGETGVENATQWDIDLYHAPQYMPGYPTAATIFPRAINVSCIKTVAGLNCKGYNWSPEMGRSEYLLIRPVIVKELPK